MTAEDIDPTPSIVGDQFEYCRQLYYFFTSQSASFVFALDGGEADGLLALFVLLISVRLQIPGAQTALVLLLPHPPLLRLTTDGGTQSLLLFLQRETG